MAAASVSAPAAIAHDVFLPHAVRGDICHLSIIKTSSWACYRNAAIGPAYRDIDTFVMICHVSVDKGRCKVAANCRLPIPCCRYWLVGSTDVANGKTQFFCDQ